MMSLRSIAIVALCTLAMCVQMVSPARAEMPEEAVSTASFVLDAPNPIKSFEAALDDIEGLLKRFRPQGVTVAHLTVKGNYMEFLATKKVMFISKSAWVRGSVETREEGTCGIGGQSYRMTMALDRSDRLVSDNVSELNAHLCVTAVSDTRISVLATATMRKGPNYDSILGGIARDLIAAQVTPLLQAFKESFRSYAR